MTSSKLLQDGMDLSCLRVGVPPKVRSCCLQQRNPLEMAGGLVLEVGANALDGSSSQECNDIANGSKERTPKD